jgi:hypothetical protein
MAQPPSYPDEAPVGDPVGKGLSIEDKKADSGRKRQIVTGAAIGIGSAALVAALLYANRSKKRTKRDNSGSSSFTPEGAD